MGGPSLQLTAVMFTDLVGFSRMTHRDEHRALALLEEHREIVRPRISKFEGREVKTIGDGFLVAFGSARQAILCATDIQQAVHLRNAKVASDALFQLRIGIHVGNVVHSAGDVYGDAVNIAARIEPVAEPGGVCVSRQVFDAVRTGTDVPLESVGTRTVKNIETPIELFRVRFPWTRDPPPSVPSSEISRPPAEPLDQNGLNVHRLVVLPFANLSPDPDDEFFADGMTEELIERLTHVAGLKVIARTTAMHFKNHRETVKEVGRALRVGTVLEGSVRKAGPRMRLTAQLIDANTEEPLWSSRYDRDVTDVFAIQDDLAGRIAVSVSDRLTSSGRPIQLQAVPVGPETPDLEAYTSFLQGRKLLAERLSESTVRQSIPLFERALERDPGLARARVGIAAACLWLAAEGAMPAEEAKQRARQELDRALRANEALAEAHSALAQLFLTEDELAASERESRRAIDLNPSLAEPYRWLAQIVAAKGEIDEAVRLLETAYRVDPLDINIAVFLGHAYVYARRDVDAIRHLERIRPMVPFRTNAHLAEYYLARNDLGRVEECLYEMDRYRPGNPWTLALRGFFEARRGNGAAAREILARLEHRPASGVTGFLVGFVAHAVGEDDRFFARMYEADEQGNLPVLELLYSPLFEDLRTDPRLQELLAAHRARVFGGASDAG